MRPDHVIIAQKYDNNIEEPKYRWVVLEVDPRCEAPLLKTASASMGQVLDNRTLTDSRKLRRAQYSAGELAVRHGEATTISTEQRKITLGAKLIF